MTNKVMEQLAVQLAKDERILEATIKASETVKKFTQAIAESAKKLMASDLIRIPILTPELQARLLKVAEAFEKYRLDYEVTREDHLIYMRNKGIMPPKRFWDFAIWYESEFGESFPNSVTIELFTEYHKWKDKNVIDPILAAEPKLLQEQRLTQPIIATMYWCMDMNIPKDCETIAEKFGWPKSSAGSLYGKYLKVRQDSVYRRNTKRLEQVLFLLVEPEYIKRCKKEIEESKKTKIVTR